MGLTLLGFLHQPRFNRAARFARLVASLESELGKCRNFKVSIGPRVSRGWWHRFGSLRVLHPLNRSFNRAARFARLVAEIFH